MPTIVRHLTLSAFAGDAIDNVRKAIAAAVNTLPVRLIDPWFSLVALRVVRGCFSRYRTGFAQSFNVGEDELFPFAGQVTPNAAGGAQSGKVGAIGRW